MFGFQKYNHDVFTKESVSKDLTAGRRAGPNPGERAPDFEARTLDGDKIRLSDFSGRKNVVLTLGSVTCPMTAGSIRGINELYDEYSGDDVQFLFVYVREAHPGDRVPAHESLEDKVRAAELLRDEEQIEMPILVDDLRGSIHRKYGKLPNSTFIIDKSGRVAFRALWTRPRVVEGALEALLERQRDRGVERAVVSGGEDSSMPMTYPIIYLYRALERGGPRALADFRRVMGVPGRMALVTSRVAQPVAMHPGKALAAAALTGGVIVAGIYAGSKLRQRRFRMRGPYRVHEYAERHHAATGTDDYEPVGI
jgi:peroxiredoxin